MKRRDYFQYCLCFAFATLPWFTLRADFYYGNFNSINGLTLNGSAEQVDNYLRLIPSGETVSVGSAFRTDMDYVGYGFSTTFVAGWPLNPSGESEAFEGLSFAIQNSTNGPTELGGMSNSVHIQFELEFNGLERILHTSIENDHASISLPERGFTVRIDYMPGTLSVFVNDPSTPLLTVDINLDQFLNLNERRAWVGFQASGGSNADVCYIESWSFMSFTPNTYAFQVDSAVSTLSLSGTAQTTYFDGGVPTGTEVLPIVQQNPGSLTAHYSGTIWVDLDDLQHPTSVLIKSSDLVAGISGQWQPLPSGGGIGLNGANANYGWAVNTTGFGQVVAAFRGLGLNFVPENNSATVTGGQFPSGTQVWSRKKTAIDRFSPQLGNNVQASGAPTGLGGAIFEVTLGGNSGGNGLVVFANSTVTLSVPVTIPILLNVLDDSFFGNLGQGGFGVRWNCTLDGNIIAKLTLPAAAITDSRVFHEGWSGGGSSVDLGKQMLRQIQAPQQANVGNLINTARGINGVQFEVQNFANPTNISSADFTFQVSPQGAFNQTAHPPGGWAALPSPMSITFQAGNPDKILIRWPDGAIRNRWLRVTVKANANTGLIQNEVYYLGHLQGETTGPTNGTYTVSFSDITGIRAAVGQSVDASSIADIDKNGIVSFSDIAAMRSNVGQQLTNITVP